MPDPVEGISVVLIAKNCEKSIKDTLMSLQAFLRPEDEVVVVDTGSSDLTPKVCENFGAKVFLHPELCVPGMLTLVDKYLPEFSVKLQEDPQFKDGFLADFAGAREVANSHAKHDIIFWLDSDDILTGGKELRAEAEEFFKTPGRICLFLAYDYSFDADGKCNTVLWRERLVRKSLFKWTGVCHETLTPNSGVPTEMRRIDPAVSKLVHKHGRAHIYSDIRNYAILRDTWDKARSEKAWLDPRWELYLGNACRGLERWQEAVEWYSKVLQRSGSREDRLACGLNIGYCHILFGRHWRAIDWFFQAVKIHPGEPRAYYGIARAFYELKRYQDCLLYSSMGRNLGTPDQLTSVDPNTFDYYPGVFECLSLKELGQVDQALMKAREVVALRPNFPASKELLQDALVWAQDEKLKQAVQIVTSTAFSQEGALDMVTAIRPEIRKQIPELQVETWCASPKKSITFLCGVTHETWDPSSIESGIGGSEKMVLLLAPQLAKLGWRVEVYGNPRPTFRYKTVDGVTYKPAQSFNPLLERGILIVWRNWGYLDLPLKAKKIFLDLHDVQSPGDYTESRLAKLSGIFFKSKFHLEPVKEVCPANLAIVSRNAIDTTHFSTNGVERKLKKIVYCSSADRGLLGALRIFSRIKALHPDSEFHIFYGFTPLYLKRAADVEYQHFGDCHSDRHMLDYAEDCFELSTRLGCTWHGRIGHKALAEELKSASVYMYRTEFPEISCMAAMEAQAAGCLPVVSSTGALKETVDFGITIPPERDDDAFISAVNSIFVKGADYYDYRKQCSEWAQATYAVPELAAAWSSHFEAPS